MSHLHIVVTKTSHRASSSSSPHLVHCSLTYEAASLFCTATSPAVKNASRMRLSIVAATLPLEECSCLITRGIMPGTVPPHPPFMETVKLKNNQLLMHFFCSRVVFFEEIWSYSLFWEMTDSRVILKRITNVLQRNVNTKYICIIGVLQLLSTNPLSLHSAS